MVVKQPKQQKQGWKPGESGNPAGRPRKALSITKELRDYLVKHPETIKQIIRSLLDMVVKRHNVQAMQELLNRIDGKVAEKHELEGVLPVMLVFKPAEPKQLPEADVVDIPPDDVKVL